MDRGAWVRWWINGFNNGFLFNLGIVVDMVLQIISDVGPGALDGWDTYRPYLLSTFVHLMSVGYVIGGAKPEKAQSPFRRRSDCTLSPVRWGLSQLVRGSREDMQTIAAGFKMGNFVPIVGWHGLLSNRPSAIRR